jgi:signal transduction histidine kinase
VIRLFTKFCCLTLFLGFACRWAVFALLDTKVYTDRDRVVSGMTEVHVGGLHILASELASSDEHSRQGRWEAIQQELHSPIEIRPLDELSGSERKRLSDPKGFIYVYRNKIIDYLGVPLDVSHYLRLGPIAERIETAIEKEAADWLKILSRKIESSTDTEAMLAKISREADVPVCLTSRESLPLDALRRLEQGQKPTFYSIGENYFVAALLEHRNELLRMGPLPRVRITASQSVNTAMGLWLACVIGANGWLVYNLASKFRRIQQAAIQLSQGRFDTRVDETKAGESIVLANAFNLMASKTESSIRSKNELLQVVSHELRTPLSRLRFAVELLDVSKDEEVKSSRMMIIRQSIDNLDAIVDEVLEYVRNEETEPSKTREWIEIQPGLEPMISVLQLEYPTLRFEWVGSGTPPPTDVYADRISFHRAMGNLLSNAARYAKSIVRIHVYPSFASWDSDDSTSLDPKSPVTEMLCIEVEDDGPGVPEDKRREILAPFVRLHPDCSTTRAIHQAPLQNESKVPSHDRYPELQDTHNGLGLGLAIVDRVLKQHGGSVRIEQGNLGGCLVRTFWPNE